MSYSRILQVERQLADTVCHRSIIEGVVCPSQFRKGLFTVGAIDNLDYNPSSTTAKGSFHGTGISLFQSHLKSEMGQYRESLTLPSEDTHHQLPDWYTTVTAVALNTSKVKVPEHPKRTQGVEGDMVAAMNQEHSWLDSAIEILQKEQLEKGDSIAWAAYHAALQDASGLTDIQPAITQLLPLFYEKAATVAMLKHGMDVV